jgi:hypothetical protein
MAFAMLMHERLGSSCALSHLDDSTKDALLCMVLANFKQNMTLTAVYFDSTCDEEPEDPEELRPEEPHELSWPLKFEDGDTPPCFWSVRDEQNRTVDELMFHAYDCRQYETEV